MSAVSPNQRTGFWGKVKTSTKSLSSSLSHLTEKTETDGDTEDSTVVHKALVKFYESQDPFLGFPAWLGEKENLPDEQKILRKQAQQAAKSAATAGTAATTSNNEPSGRGAISKLSSGFMGLRMSSSSSKSGSDPQASPERRTTAGMAFHNIYSKESPGLSPSNSPETTPGRFSSESSPSKRLGNTLGAGYSRSTANTTSSSEGTTAPVLVRNPSQLMTERLRGRR